MDTIHLMADHRHVHITEESEGQYSLPGTLSLKPFFTLLYGETNMG